MRILLDEGVPVQLKGVLIFSGIKSVNDKDLGWKGIKNGKLLAVIEGKFDILITNDKHMYAEQNLTGRPIAILVLPTNRLKDVLALAGAVQAAIAEIVLGQYVMVELSGSSKKRSFGPTDPESGNNTSGQRPPL